MVANVQETGWDAGRYGLAKHLNTECHKKKQKTQMTPKKLSVDIKQRKYKKM